MVDNFTYTLESLVQAGKMLVAVDEVPIGDQPADARVAAGRVDRRLRAPQHARDPADLRALRAAAGLRQRRRSWSAPWRWVAWLPFLIDAIFNGKSNGHIQSLILGAVLFIAAVQLFALGVIGDLLAGQRVMTQRIFERVRRVELALGVPPSHTRRAARPAASEQETTVHGPPRRGADRGGGARRRRDRGGRMSGTNGASANGAGKAPASSADYGKTASFLAVGVGLTGVITYAYFLIASHTLSKPDYGQITVLWSAVFITISTLYRPIEQLLSRHISERVVKGQSLSEPMRVASTIQFGLSLLFTVVALALRGPIQNSLLEGNETLYWVFFTSVLFYAASYFARGFLAGSQRFGLFVALILSESCFRTIFAVLVVVGILSGQGGRDRDHRRAGALPAGRPLRLRPQSAERQSCGAPAAGRRRGAERFSFRHGGGFAAAVLLIMFSEQAFLNAGPLVIRGLQGAAEAGFIFNVLMIARAPLQLFQSISTSILPHLTSLHTSEDPESDREFGHTVRMVLLGIVAFTALALVFMAAVGPKAMQIAFGKNFTYDRAGLLLVTVGMGLYLASVTLNQACVAQGQVRRAAARWITCAVIFIGWNFVPLVSNEQRRVEFGFLIAAGVLFALLYWVYRRPHAHAGDTPTPGSPEELEARLAIIDENV